MKSPPARYTARDGAVVGHNRGRAFNRPLYVAHTNAFVLAGDLPAARFVCADTIHGTLIMGVSRGGRTRWLHEAADITLEYRAARATWIVRDPAFRGLTATFDVVAQEDEIGFAARVRGTGVRKGDALVWAFAGAVTFPGPEKNLNWEYDPHVNPAVGKPPFDPAHGVGNRVQVTKDGYRLASQTGASFPTAVRCSAKSVAVGRVADPACRLNEAAYNEYLLPGGRVDLKAHPEVMWSFTREKAGSRRKPSAPARRFAAGLKRSAALAARIVVETPDGELNAAAAAVSAALDGAWYPPVFRHGAMLWNRPFPGWRTTCGGTAAGWHGRVKAMAAYYCGHQLRSSPHRSGRADPKLKLCVPAPDSRFYGAGRIVQDQAVYNMQSQFFDQLVRAWRWTGDAELEKILRPALELHLEWLRECFDPDGDGLYESVINCWPTDSVWYGGGGGAEDTAHAYYGHRAAADMARRAGDRAAAKRHDARSGFIQQAFFARLWLKSKRHSAFYREQGGLERLHEDAWLYSIFMPIDAGLVEADDAVASLDYTEHSLQNVTTPRGGRRVWTSNFVPGIWSVRELWPGDNHHLALAYFQTGLAREGWDVFRGNFHHTAFDQLVPGDFGSPLGGTDFGDSTHMFARTLVEGLFGYAPDYPNGIVRIAPQFPDPWDRARLRTSDVSLDYRKTATTVRLEVKLAQAAAGIQLHLPVCAHRCLGVTANGVPVGWHPSPGYGRTILQVDLPAGRGATVVVTTSGNLPFFAPVAIGGKQGERVPFRAGKGSIQGILDPQGVLGVSGSGMDFDLGAKLVGPVGHHTIVARVAFGQHEQWRIYRIRIDPAIPGTSQAFRHPAAAARWDCIDLGRTLNGDIRTIFQQEYLSPRPETVSARIGSNGYSPWTFVYWDSGPPEIALDAVPGMIGRGGRRLLTPQGVPFGWKGGARNVAFVSRWDNWPDRVAVKVGRKGASAWFLICGSTNPMQCRIANAVLRLKYADGGEETLELVPPVNYWNLCPVRVNFLAPGQENRDDYVTRTDAFCLPAELPQTVQLGANCRAMLLSAPLRPGKVLERVTLEALSAEVVVGLMGVTVMK